MTVTKKLGLNVCRLLQRRGEERGQGGSEISRARSSPWWSIVVKRFIFFVFCFHKEMMFVYASMPAIIISYLQSEFVIEIQWRFYLFWLTICIVSCQVDTLETYLLSYTPGFINGKYKLCKFYFIDKFVKIFANIVGNADHLLEYWIYIHNNKGIQPALSSLSTKCKHSDILISS